MPRSINTVLTVELVLFALFLLGGASLRDFTFAMMVGITVGAYSSIFNAAQLLVVMKNWEERRIAARRAAGRPVREMAERGGTARRPRPVSPRPLAQKPAQAAAAAEEEADAMIEEAEASPEMAAAQDGTPRSARRKLKAARKRKRRF
jgi:hypothetical protein